MRSIGIMVAFLLVWLVFLFASYGLFAYRHFSAIVVLPICSATASGAIFLILALQRGTQGVTRIMPEPLLNAIELLNRGQAAP